MDKYYTANDSNFNTVIPSMSRSGTVGINRRIQLAAARLGTGGYGNHEQLDIIMLSGDATSLVGQVKRATTKRSQELPMQTSTY